MTSSARPYDYRNPEPLAVKPSTAAKMMDCSRQHIYNLIERGELRRCQIAGSASVRVPVEDVYRVLGLDEVTS